MQKLHLIYNYLIYRAKSVNEHGVHSPFVYDLLLSTIYNKKKFYAYIQLEKLRNALSLSNQKVNCIDLGAGSKINNSNTKSVQTILYSSSKPAKYAQLLFRLVNHFQPTTILELGTSLGISSGYMASANSKSKLITIEGCEEIANIAKSNFQKLELKNIEQVVGNFDEVLPTVLKNINQLEFVFFDGNHRKEPTLNYFSQCLEKANEKSVFIFDDIYWSKEMKEAWEEIKKNEKVTVTLDLFYLGIVFFRTEQVKQNFIIRY
ncbi:MAG TPA: class I SAM-dependent methyltransferase [Bacteroidia bacterium]|nr:class I SAM-dependent methyltransferase [Bacteroidia bacterium]